jgi:hypothetical protein
MEMNEEAIEIIKRFVAYEMDKQEPKWGGWSALTINARQFLADYDAKNAAVLGFPSSAAPATPACRSDGKPCPTPIGGMGRGKSLCEQSGMCQRTNMEALPTVHIAPATPTDGTVRAFRTIKEIVCGERAPYWNSESAIYNTRGLIADVCDNAMLAAAPDTPAPAATATAMDVMVQRFLGWPVPFSVCADLCATRQEKGRSGTNLLSAIEAREMLTYVLAAAPANDARDAQKLVECKHRGKIIRGNDYGEDKAWCDECGEITFHSDAPNEGEHFRTFSDRKNWSDKRVIAFGCQNEANPVNKLNDGKRCEIWCNHNYCPSKLRAATREARNQSGPPPGRTPDQNRGNS